MRHQILSQLGSLEAEAPRYTVAVRALCEFAAKRGDLDLRFTPSPSAQEGIAGHASVANDKLASNKSYQREVPLNGRYLHLQVRGRADGYDPLRNRLDEVKTYRGDLARMPANHRYLHWAQAKIYGWLVCQRDSLESVEIALVYFDVGTQKETVLCESFNAKILQDFFEDLCNQFLVWADQELEHRAKLDMQLAQLQFPYSGFRSGQRELSEAIFKANSQGRCLMAQAPTGIGKTVGTLFPALKAFPKHGSRETSLDKLFFLTAKTPGRQVALEAMRKILVGTHQEDRAKQGLRVLELVARDKACEHPDKACHGDSCPLAKGFYDRLPMAREAAAKAGFLDKAELKTIALEHQVCPYYLGTEMARWCDVVVGDYNHYFDLNASLHSLTLNEGWRVGILVDEAHNLIDRARQMYSADLKQRIFDRAKMSAPATLKKSFQKVTRRWNALIKDQAKAYQVYEQLPDKLIFSLQELNSSLAEYFAEHPAELNLDLQQFYFDLLHFLKLTELIGTHSIFDITIEAQDANLCLRNVVPANLLRERWRSAYSAALFSATLSPIEYFHEMLGLPENTVSLEVPSPFDPAQFQVNICEHISTRYADRPGSLASLSELIGSQYRALPGNYLAFFSSFDYLQNALNNFNLDFPDIPTWHQERGMSEASRDGFLARFTDTSQGIGFAVLGGAFGEGIDLPGARLIGAFIATLGLPQINPVNEQFRATIDSLLGRGYAYTYLIPGIQKVIQAAGRVIRTRSDTGVLFLMDDRFSSAEVRQLLPSWWGETRILSLNRPH
jgi:DNA excision repair protein ERCC-2